MPHSRSNVGTHKSSRKVKDNYPGMQMITCLKSSMFQRVPGGLNVHVIDKGEN